MQRGQVYRHNGSWLLRFYDLTADGKIRRTKKLARVSPEYPTKSSVMPLADKVLSPLNSGQLQAESSLPVVTFIADYYLPFVKRELRPSTYVDYTTIFRAHVKERLGDIRLRDFRTVHAQKLMRSIPGVGHTSLLRIKSFLSGVFKHAKREGFLDGLNPIMDVSVPGRPIKFKGATYTLDEIQAVAAAIAKVDMQAFAVISTAAFAGLRSAELRGLRWADYDGQTLTIRRSIWRTHVGLTKTESSEGTVPVLPILRKILDAHRQKTKGQDDDYIFRGERLHRPLSLANLVRRVIVPAVAKANAEIQKEFDDYAVQQSSIMTVLQTDPGLLKWKGFHAFRRSLASNLFAAGVAPKIIQAILRHSDVQLTMQWYVTVPDADTRNALQKIEDQIS
jgi:integrase